MATSLPARDNGFAKREWCHRPASVLQVDDERLVGLLEEVADAVGEALRMQTNRALSGSRPGQYAVDLVADAAALEVLEPTDLGILSEESGLHHEDAGLVVVLDPLDGSTNWSRGIPWFATSICVVDEAGPRIGLVANLATGVRYRASRSEGSSRDGTPIGTSDCEDLHEAIVGLSGYPPSYLGWAQYRALGAAALDLCLVAEGVLDAYVVVGGSTLGPWDYMAGLLVCEEAGATVREARGEELVTLDAAARRQPVAAASAKLAGSLVAQIGAHREH